MREIVARVRGRSPECEFVRVSPMLGNGVNHPNDWGYRVSAQVITRPLDPGEPSDSPDRTAP